MEGTEGGIAVVEVAVLKHIGGMEIVHMVAVVMVEEMMIEISGTMTREEGLEAVALGIEDEAEALPAGGIGVQ